jgi:hypothetical protein
METELTFELDRNVEAETSIGEKAVLFEDVTGSSITLDVRTWESLGSPEAVGIRAS